MRQSPHWLPYRVRSWIDQRRIDRALAGLERTAPAPAAAPAEADAEVHLLLCRRDLWVGVLTLKSLLRFKEAHWAVSLSDDGTLGPEDRAWVDRHIPGVRWLDWPDAQGLVEWRLTSGELPGPPRAVKTSAHRLRALYRGGFPLACKLLHPMLLGRCQRLLVLDPNTAFFARPERLIGFANGQESGPLYLHDHQDEAAAVPTEVKAALRDAAARIAPPGRTWQLQHCLFNSGLLAYRLEQLDLGLAEAFLAWQAELPENLTQDKAAIWFGPWTREQTCYHVMFAFAEPPPKPLGGDYHLGGAAGHVFNHFLRHYLVQARTLARLRRLVAELPRS